MLIKQLIIELRNKCSGLHSPSGPPNSADVDTEKDFSEDEPTIASLSPDQRSSVAKMMGLLFLKDIVNFFETNLQYQPPVIDDLGQSEA